MENVRAILDRHINRQWRKGVVEYSLCLHWSRGADSDKMRQRTGEKCKHFQQNIWGRAESAVCGIA